MVWTYKVIQSVLSKRNIVHITCVMIEFTHSGNRRGSRGRGRGRYNVPRKNVLNFQGDFDFESSNAQFNKEDIAKELMEKLKITGKDYNRMNYHGISRRPTIFL